MLYVINYYALLYYMFTGSRAWIRIPTIMYATNIITVILPIVYSVAVDDFAKMNRVGPVTQDERLKLLAAYLPYLVIPALMILTMLFSQTYKSGRVSAVSEKAQQKKKQPSHNKKRQ